MSLYEQLPKKRMAAGALFLNERQEILIVKPAYREFWYQSDYIIILTLFQYRFYQAGIRRRFLQQLNHLLGNLAAWQICQLASQDRHCA